MGSTRGSSSGCELRRRTHFGVVASGPDSQTSQGFAVMSVEPILISGEWRRANAAGTFHAEDPSNRQPLSQQFPVSAWEDCDAALDAAVEAADTLRTLPVDRIAAFLSAYADSLDRHADEICDVASRETGLPVSPRLKDVELPRTVNQLHQAAAAAAEQTWRRATIDGKANIRSYYAALGTVCVFGPNNFPLAFNSIAGG
ncbi:MAG: aldehyde dehydrogenase family protein, partial [Planctomycetota bacterium]